MGKTGETVNDRMKKVRKALKMTQQEFAGKFGLSDSALSRIEKGENSLTDYNILLICTPNRLQDGKTVSEAWLRTGEGDMFEPPSAYPLDERLEKLKADEKELIELYDQLSPEMQKEVRKYIDERLKLQEMQEKTDDLKGISTNIEKLTTSKKRVTKQKPTGTEG